MKLQSGYKGDEKSSEFERASWFRAELDQLNQRTRDSGGRGKGIKLMTDSAEQWNHCILGIHGI